MLADIIENIEKYKYRLSLGKAVNFTDINNAPFCLNKLRFPLQKMVEY